MIEPSQNRDCIIDKFPHSSYAVVEASMVEMMPSHKPECFATQAQEPRRIICGDHRGFCQKSTRAAHGVDRPICPFHCVQAKLRRGFFHSASPNCRRYPRRCSRAPLESMLIIARSFSIWRFMRASGFLRSTLGRGSPSKRKRSQTASFQPAHRSLMVRLLLWCWHRRRRFDHDETIRTVDSFCSLVQSAFVGRETLPWDSTRCPSRA